MNTEALWEAYHEHVRRFVNHKTNFHPDAEDIVQNVFIKAFARLDDVKDDLKIRAWLFQIARNCIVDHYRKEKRTDELPDQLRFDDEYEEPDPNQEAVIGLKNVIRLLPDKYREALEFSELKGMSQKELSEHLGISYSGAKSRVQRGREMLKEMMTSCCDIEADRYGNIIDYRVMLEEPTRLSRS
ncbi:RNA polymerase sigma-70 factor (ECF subfamily) [Paenibacillus forsythiae]|uniref:RNA polymerase sigma factor n=1 Tax=Paenibacillus forsythiae TaxID=365616 RepID=A0ABU3HDJ4_9BACL|nr:RNA polymerase sigma factor SigZ [Paenibacillus forsythiae]MDT3428891.1 RNA polymerase sigma-70 factor (ECF subfamily) [Paenibacillus forsythiae]